MSEEHTNGGAQPISKRDSILQRVGKREMLPAQMPGSDGELIDVLVQELTGTEAELFESATAAGAANTLGMLVQLSVVDPETKELLFEPADRSALQQLGMKALKPVIEIANALSGVTVADIQKAQAFLATRAKANAG